MSATSAADRAGLRPTHRANGRVLLGDILVAVDGQTVKTYNDLLDTLERKQVGDTVTVTVLRANERVDAPVTLEESQ